MERRPIGTILLTATVRSFLPGIQLEPAGWTSATRTRKVLCPDQGSIMFQQVRGVKGRERRHSRREARAACPLPGGRLQFPAVGRGGASPVMLPPDAAGR